MALVVGTNSYINLIDAEAYFLHKIHAADWDSATDPTKTDALVTATSMLDRQNWQGSKTQEAPTQALDFPRTGLTDPEGTAIASDAVPQFVLDATCELALALIQNLSVQTQKNTEQNIKRLKAGTAEIEYFRGISGGRFPTIVQELIGYYLLGATGWERPFAEGTDVESGLSEYEVNRGY